MDVEVKGLLKKEVSKKGKEYYCVKVPITPNYTATFFPSNAEVELLNMYYGNNAKQENNNNLNNEDLFKNFE